MEHLFARKIYQQMLEWKVENQGKTALLIEGARRIGKSTIAELFARQEYRTQKEQKPEQKYAHWQ